MKLKKYRPTSSKPKKPVVVLSESFGALAVVRNLRKKGVPVIKIGREMILKSFYGETVRVEGDLKKTLCDLSRTLKEKPILFTDGEHYIDFIRDNWDWIKKKYIFHSTDFSVYDKLVKKQILYNVASKINFNLPKTYYGDKQKGVKNFPTIVKPLDSLNFSKTHGKKAIKCYSKKELKKTLELLGKEGLESITQEIIKGDPSNLWSITLYRNKRGGIIIGYLGHKIRQNPPNFGTVTSFVTCKNDYLIEKSIELLEKTGFEGLANIEYKFCEKTKKYYIIEVNGRFAMATGICDKIKNNFVYEVYLDMLNPSREIRKYGDLEKEVVWICPERDFLVLRKLKCKIFKEIIKLFSYKIKNAHFELRDPLPSFIVWKEGLGKILKNGKDIHDKN